MYARVTITQGSPEKADEAIRYVREHIIPAVQKQSGFKGGYWLADRARGKGMVMTLWESAEAERASDAMAAQARSRVMAILGGEIKSVDVYDVFAQVPPGGAGPARARATRGRPVRTRATKRGQVGARATKRRVARTKPRKAGRRRRA